MVMLEKQIIEIPLGVGVDTKSSEKVVQPGSLLRAENAVLTTPGEARKRFGYERIPMIREDGTQLDNVMRIYSDGDNLLAAADDRGEVYEEKSGRWRDAGALGCFRVTRKELAVRDITTEVNAEIACAKGFAVVAWNETGPQFRYSVINVQTGEVVVSRVLVSASASYKFGVCSLADRYVMILYASSLLWLDALVFDMENPTATPVTKSINTDTTPPVGDARSMAAIEVPATGKCVAVYKSDASGLWGLAEFDQNGATGNISLPLAAAPLDGDRLVADSSGRIYVLTASGVEVHASVGGAVSGPTAIAGATRMLGIVQADGDGVDLYVNILGSTYGGIDEDNRIERRAVSSAAVVSVSDLTVYGVQPIGQIFRRNGKAYLTVALRTNDDLQNSLFLLDSSGNALARISINTSVITVGSHIYGPAYAMDDDTVFVFCAEASGTLFSVKLDFAAIGNSAKLTEALFVAGGQLYEFNGTSVVEHGFQHYPSHMSITSANSTGSVPSSASLLYKAVYTWIDRRGNTHYSAPSASFAHTTGVADDTVTVIVRNLHLTQKTSVKILLYRTTNGGTDFYLTTTADNVTSSTGTSMVDSKSDATLILQQALYTAGGVLENLAPPSPIAIESFGNRLFAITGENIIHHSKRIQEERGVEFAEEFRLILDRRGGSLSSMKDQESQLVVARERALGRITGDGPNDKGDGGFTIDDSIPSEAGAEIGAPMIETSLGTMFKSPGKGIFLLDRSLQSAYAGAAVEKYNASQVSDNETHPQRNEVLFSHRTGELLRLDTMQKQWVVDPDICKDGVTSVASYRGRIYASTRGGKVIRESDGYRDGDSYFSFVLEAPQIHVGGLAGFQRCWWLYVLGEYRSPHTLNAWLYYDNESEPSEKIAQVVSAKAPYLMRIKPGKQKCGSLKVLLFDSKQSGSGESARLNILRVVVGMKPKNTKAQKVGV